MIPVITVAIAPSRYTFECVTQGIREFTINIPNDKIEEAINITGSLSGRNSDKIARAGLKTIKGRKTKVPTLDNCILSYECKIVHECKSGTMASHHLFFGEILASYASKEIFK